jgi:pilus assembly protein CpaE
MWSTAVASADAENAGYLRACLQQTGQVGSVAEWKPSSRGEWQIRPGESIPDIVVLGMSVDNMQAFFAFATLLRRARPTVRIIACSPPQEPDLSFVLQAMRSGNGAQGQVQVAVPQTASKEAVRIVLQAMRSGVQEFLPAPVSAGALQEAFSRFSKEDETGDASVATEKLIVVMGAKGGVGASTVAINLGVQLAQSTKKRVVLLDMARPMGHVSLLLDMQPRFTIRDATENLERLDSHFFGGLLTQHKTGLEVLAGPSNLGEWQQIPVSGLTRVVNVAQSAADFVIMDYGSSYSPDWNPVLRLARMILLVAEPDVPSLWALERLTAALACLGRDSDWIRLIINRCSRKDDETLKAVEKNLKRTVFARLPNDFRSVSEATNLGTPLSKKHKTSLTSAFRALAGQVAGKPAALPAPRKWWFLPAKKK